MTDAHVLRIDNVNKSFNRRKILKGISLDVKEGEILALIGASGSGKTTLLKSIIGFNVPEQGDVKFRYVPVASADKARAKKEDFHSVFAYPDFVKSMFGFASQEPSFYEKLTVKENLHYFGALYGLGDKELATNVEVLLALMDLKDAENTLGSKLSGGMQRRLDIACAMIHDPDILILDEPTSDLDPALRTHIWSLVRKINKRGTTIIISSHHLSEIESLASRIAILRQGALVDVDSPSRLRARYADTQSIFIHTYPGDYGAIFEKTRKANVVSSAKVMTDGLIIKSKKPRQALSAIMAAIESLDEELIDIRVFRPGLDELFLKLTKVDE